MQMGEGLRQILQLFGGLALFLYGMDSLTEALEQAAGPGMKHFLQRLTGTPLTAVLAGAAVTAVLQSSSAATVMVIGFVGAGLLELPAAIAVIFGANIGTTVTAQLLAFRLEDGLGALLFLGFFLRAVSRQEKGRQSGRALFSLGMLFLGIREIGEAMEPLAESPVFLGWMHRVGQESLLGLLLGLGMTLTIQSSSATIAVLQNAAQQAGPDGAHSLLGLAGAVPVLLGDNVGTTITAVLAAAGQSRQAKRVAAAHCCFNLSGSLVCLAVLPGFVRLVELVSPIGPETEVIVRQIANAHSLFNLLCTAVWLPLLPGMVRWVRFLVPEKKDEKS